MQGQAVDLQPGQVVSLPPQWSTGAGILGIVIGLLLFMAFYYMFLSGFAHPPVREYPPMMATDYRAEPTLDKSQVLTDRNGNNYVFVKGYQARVSQSQGAKRVQPNTKWYKNDLVLADCRADPTCLAADTLGWLKPVLPLNNASGWRYLKDWDDKNYGTYIMTDRVSIPSFVQDKIS